MNSARETGLFGAMNCSDFTSMWLYTVGIRRQPDPDLAPPAATW